MTQITILMQMMSDKELVKIRTYVENHPEVFDDGFDEKVAEIFLNVNTVRKAIRQVYWETVSELEVEIIN